MFQEFRLLAVNHLFKQETDASTCFSSFKACIKNVIASYGLVKKLLFKVIKIFVSVSSDVWNLSICVNVFNITNRWYILEQTCSFKLSQDYIATTIRQFTFYHSVLRSSWYSFNRPQKDERPSWSWSFLVVLNPGPLDWESSALTTRPLLCDPCL